MTERDASATLASFVRSILVYCREGLPDTSAASVQIASGVRELPTKSELVGGDPEPTRGGDHP